jgi:hypothetical protein
VSQLIENDEGRAKRLLHIVELAQLGNAASWRLRGVHVRIAARSLLQQNPSWEVIELQSGSAALFIWPQTE